VQPESGGRHLVVAVPAGHSRVRLRYSPPGLRAACVLAAAALVLVAALALARTRAPLRG
jgi:uncharacterized membrane protein YfhO